jgi:molybdopterin/thiamine biosynthesis adenylyltransferase
MTSATPPPPSSSSGWAYDEAFARHRGLISADEQRVLKGKRVAIVGQGGVGGVHLITLARLGIGGFHIADPDHFEVANFNRQYGASVRTLGQNKALVMAEEARAINPELALKVFTEPITAGNIDELLDGVDLVLDGIDFFSLPTRRLLFTEARRRRLWALTAGPIGFSAAYLVFDPAGMSFDEYFDLNDAMDRADQLVAFLTGLTPRASHLAYLDLKQVDPRSGRGPSAGLACQLCAGVAAAEVVKILLGRTPIRPVPWYFQFDAYRQRLYQA